MDRWRVQLPPSVRPPYEVWVNGVRREEGIDYDVEDRTLLFREELVQEGKLGFWRWFLGAWGIGTYRRNDVIDVRYTLNGRPMVAHELPVEQPRAPG